VTSYEQPHGSNLKPQKKQTSWSQTFTTRTLSRWLYPSLSCSVHVVVCIAWPNSFNVLCSVFEEFTFYKTEDINTNKYSEVDRCYLIFCCPVFQFFFFFFNYFNVLIFKIIFKKLKKNIIFIYLSCQLPYRVFAVCLSNFSRADQ
jgi:hypothetical protein